MMFSLDKGWFGSTGSVGVEKLRGCVQAFRNCHPSLRSPLLLLSATSTACTKIVYGSFPEVLRPKRWARRIRFPSSATERREDERGHRRPVGPPGDQELGEDAGARWVTFAWLLAPWMLSVFLCGPIACGIDATPVLNWESGCIYTAGSGIDHVISVVGWGKDAGCRHGAMHWAFAFVAFRLVQTSA